MAKYRIIFRTCDLVYSVHGVARPFNLDKRSIIKSCFQSLVESVRDFPHEIVILGDRLSDEMMDFFSAFPVQLINETLTNERSIARSLEISASFPEDEWVYFCEDDYLHVRWAFEYIDDFITNRDGILGTTSPTRDTAITEFGNMPLFIHPADYPDRYRPEQRKPSYLFLSRHCHWRQISNTTFTFLAEAKTIQRYLDVLKWSVHGADDDLLSREIYASESGPGSDTLANFLRKRIRKLTAKDRNTALCVSPMPGLSTHMHDGVMTPLQDWESFC